MYSVENKQVMKIPTPPQDDQSGQLVALLAQHQIFHNYLDKLVLNHEDLTTIDLLIVVRKLNLNCLNTYTDLISKKQVLSSTSVKHLGDFSRFPVSDMTLWNIHAQLARLVPHYSSALRNKQLNQVSRTIISHNYDLIIKMKEDLLHPVEEQMEQA